MRETIIQLFLDTYRKRKLFQNTYYGNFPTGGQHASFRGHSVALLNLSYFPIVWKYAEIVAIHNSGKPHPIISLVFERPLLFFITTAESPFTFSRASLNIPRNPPDKIPKNLLT